MLRVRFVYTITISLNLETRHVCSNRRGNKRKGRKVFSDVNDVPLFEQYCFNVYLQLFVIMVQFRNTVITVNYSFIDKIDIHNHTIELLVNSTKITTVL